MRLLLAVNVWVALFDDAHVFSAAANALLARPRLQIATCPLVENGVVRVLNLPGYGRAPAPGLRRVRDQLELACGSLNHEFWSDDVSLRDRSAFNFDRLHGRNQVTDAYLLALAVKHGGSLATFDRAISLDAVPGAPTRHLTLV